MSIATVVAQIQLTSGERSVSIIYLRSFTSGQWNPPHLTRFRIVCPYLKARRFFWGASHFTTRAVLLYDLCVTVDHHTDFLQTAVEEKRFLLAKVQGLSCLAVLLHRRFLEIRGVQVQFSRSGSQRHVDTQVEEAATTHRRGRVDHFKRLNCSIIHEKRDKTEKARHQPILPTLHPYKYSNSCDGRCPIRTSVFGSSTFFGYLRARPYRSTWPQSRRPGHTHIHTPEAALEVFMSIVRLNRKGNTTPKTE